MATTTKNTDEIVTLKERVNALEAQLKNYKRIGTGAAALVLILFGVGHWYEVPKVATETFDKKISEQAGNEIVDRLHRLKVEFDAIGSAQQVATARVHEAIKEKFVATDTPYLILWNGPANRWNLDVNEAKEIEGRPVGISGNGVQQWRIVKKAN